jgi:hypothetical protein
MRVIQGLCGLAVAFSLAGCGRLQALIDPPTPRPPAPTDFAPAATPDLARVAGVRANGNAHATPCRCNGGAPAAFHLGHRAD